MLSMYLQAMRSLCSPLCANGDLYCWGDGDCGQTGTQNILELLPQKVDLNNIMPSLDKVVTIGCGPFHTVVGTKFGHVYSWGQNVRRPWNRR